MAHRDLPRLILKARNSDVSEILLDLRETYGHTVSLPFANAYLVTHPDDVQTILQKNPTKFESLQVSASEDFEKVTRNSIVSLREESEYGSWADRLRILNDDFTETAAKSHEQELTVTSSASLAEFENGAHDLLDLCRRVTIRLMGVSLFSPEIRAFEDEIIEAVDTLRAAFKQKHLTIAGRFRGTSHGVNDAIESLKSVATRLVQRRMNAPWLYEDALSRWLDHVEPHVAKQEVVGMLIAGFTTLSAGLTWAVYELSQRPVLQSEIHSESFRGDVATASWKEAIRLYAPLPVFGRRATGSVQLRDISLSAGQRVIISPFVTHRDPAFWNHPESFNPDRFIESSHNEFAYYPFGIGPHACLGEAIANIEATSFLSTLFSLYDVSLESGDPGLDTAVNLQPDSEIIISLTER